MNPSLDEQISLMTSFGAVRIFAKSLSPNDNSKNQIYLGGDFSVLNIIPHGDIETDASQMAGSIRDRAKAGLRFFWLDGTTLHQAPHAQLILYPKYPEVRLSGILRGCRNAPSHLINRRLEGRVLLLAVTASDDVVASVWSSDSPAAREFHTLSLPQTGVFSDLSERLNTGSGAKQRLMKALADIAQTGWISSRKLEPDGSHKPYSAGNGGGYTLEAMLGIRPNAEAAPDYLGWEVKQYGVRDFTNHKAKSPVTLMTPEPTTGLYAERGAAYFIEHFGYADKTGREGRFNFGGRYAADRSFHKDTGVRLELQGFDSDTGKILDMNGCIALVTSRGELAAGWPFPKLMRHWKKKHANAAYVPSMRRDQPPSYRYSHHVGFHEDTDFLLFLRAVAAAQIYYDPGIKLELTGKGGYRIKKRSPFRTAHANLPRLYQKNETLNVFTLNAITGDVGAVTDRMTSGQMTSGQI